MNLMEVRFDISSGSSPVRLEATRVRLMSFFKWPISGGIEPDRGTKETLREATCEELSQVTPEKEQWAEGEEEWFQSSSPDPDGPTMEDFSFKSTSRSDREWETETKRKRIEWSKK